jgi:hypothetical protein
MSIPLEEKIIKRGKFVVDFGGVLAPLKDSMSIVQHHAGTKYRSAQN